MKIRMKDIARMANASEAVVSLVLNDEPSRISYTTENEVIAISAEKVAVADTTGAIRSTTKLGAQAGMPTLPEIEIF